MTTDVDLPVSDMEESLIEMYVDISSKLLELCDAFTSELHRLNHGNMFLNVAFSNPEEFDLSQVDRWKQYMASKNPSIENCGENKVNLEIQNTSLSESFGVIRDLEAVESGVEKLYAAVQEGCPDLLMVMEPLKQSVKQLSERYDLIYKATRCLWDEVSLARDVLSERLLT
ncbi:Uncharacterized protein Rs2_41730 [Raphanus sativus]|nr:Uncharacterized protein Rs2_41730 [Raphanus sativus]